MAANTGGERTTETRDEINLLRRRPSGPQIATFGAPSRAWGRSGRSVDKRYGVERPWPWDAGRRSDAAGIRLTVKSSSACGRQWSGSDASVVL